MKNKKLNLSTNSDIISCFYMALAKSSRDILQLNNVSVYTFENSQITPPFTERTLDISLSPILKLVTGVENKSLYCSVIYSNTSVTIKSIKEGKTNMLFKGILEVNLFIYYKTKKLLKNNLLIYLS